MQYGLEVRLRSAKDLQDVCVGGKLMHSYARAWIVTSHALHNLHKLLSTRSPLDWHKQGPCLDAADQEDDTLLYPAWPYHQSSLRLDLPPVTLSNAYLVIRLFGQRSRSPLHIFKCGKGRRHRHHSLANIVSSGSHSWQLLSYHGKRPSGRLQGVLNLSARTSDQICKEPSVHVMHTHAVSAPPSAIPSFLAHPH